MQKKRFFFHEELAPSHMPKRMRKISKKTVKFQEENHQKSVAENNKEIIIRRSIHEALLEYMVNSSLSGVRFLVDDTKTMKEKLMWLAIIGSAVCVFFYFVNNAIEFQDSQPMYMTLEDADYPVQNIIFPAIAICNHNRLKKSAVKRLVDVLYSHENTTFTSKEELLEIVTLYGNLYDYTYSKRTDIMKFNVYLEKLENIVDKNEHIRKSDISKLLLSLSPSCEETLVKCAWREVETNCSSLFRTAITQFGFCCTFNYYDTEAGRLAEDPLDPEDKPYILDNENRYRGLTVAVDAKTDEYLYATRHAYGFDILFFDRYDYADQTAGGLVHRLVSVGDQYNVEIDPYAYYTVPTIKSFPLEKRGCKFNDEMQHEFHEYYSQSCLVRCRMRTMERLCRCVPFFLPRRSNVSACTLEELSCLNKYSQKLLFVFPPQDLPGLEIERENSLNCPQCMPDCTATRYKVIFNRVIRLRKHAIPFLKELDLKNHNISLIRLHYSSRGSPVYRMDVTFYWYELVSYLGGLCGFFTGFSMMSVAEFFYYVFIRFSYIVVKNLKQHG